MRSKHIASRRRCGYPAQQPDSNLVWGILCTVLCCLPLDIVPMVYASRVSGLWAQGRYAEAQEAAWTYGRLVGQQVASWQHLRWWRGGPGVGVGLVYGAQLRFWAVSSARCLEVAFVGSLD